MSALAHILAPAEPDSAPPPASSAATTPKPSGPHDEGNHLDDPMPPPPPQHALASHENTDGDHSSPASPRTDDGQRTKAHDDLQPPTSSSASAKKGGSNGGGGGSATGGNVASVYSGNKIKHLKKEDGIPLWRRDIQYDFLRLVFDDKTRCFHKYSEGTKDHTFAEVYIDAMAKSSKCSKILKEKLLQDGDGAISMAMVCLLVNVGRMNTTLNFFPEMRAQLRTYHSIPALQAQQDPNAYKQLQDAPRLKSILKGATEDDPQPSTIEEIMTTPVPRTNPVNLIFVMSQYAPRITELHFPHPHEFFDLVVKSSISSATRARAFLWLIWWYLESDFTLESALNNPFGAGQYGEDGSEDNPLPLKVPTLQSLNEEQITHENVDTNEEQHFGEVKRKERIAILASEPSPAMTALKRARKEKGLATYSDDETMADIRGPGEFGRLLHGETGSERTRSPSPAMRGHGFQAVNSQAKASPDMRINTLLNNETGTNGLPSPTEASSTTAIPVKKGPGRGNWRRNKPKPESTRNGGETPHHVPLLPNTSQYGFVTETPGMQHIQPAGTPSSSAHQPLLAPSGSGSPVRSANISFQPPRTGAGGSEHAPTPSFQTSKRSRGPTQHQSALVNHRKKQIEYTLDRRVRRLHTVMQEAREAEGALIRGWKRIKLLPDGYDSEEELRSLKYPKWALENEGKSRTAADWDENLHDSETPKRSRVLVAGLGRVGNEPGDIGEEARSLSKTLLRAKRRLSRWQNELHSTPATAMIRRQNLQARGLLETPSKQRPLVRRHPFRISHSRRLSIANDGVDIADEQHPHPQPVRAPARGTKRARGTTGGGRSGPKAKQAKMEKNAAAAASTASSKGREQLVKDEPEPMAIDDDDDVNDDGDGDGDNDGDGDDGGGELDEEDRELLGEVDADESDSGADEDEE